MNIIKSTNKKIFIVILLLLLITSLLYILKNKTKTSGNNDDFYTQSLKYVRKDTENSDIQDKLNEKKFLKNSKKYLNEIQQSWIDIYQLNSYASWSYNQQDGKLIFFDEEGNPVVIANAQMAGSFATDIRTGSKSWMWSWRNDSIDFNVKKDILKIKSFGAKYKENFLRNDQNILSEGIIDIYEDKEIDEIVAISGYLIGAKGFYWMPVDDSLQVLALITDTKWANDEDKYLSNRANQTTGDRYIEVNYNIKGEDLSFSIPFDDYTYYITEKHHSFNSNYSNVTDFITTDDVNLNEITKKFSKNNLLDALEIIFNIVGDNYYLEDIYYGRNEYPKYPLETLVDGSGDCEDTSFLFASLLQSYLIQNQNELQNKVALLVYEEHVAIGLGFTKEIYDNLKNNFENNGYSIGAYYNEKDGYYYVYIETTSKDFNLGYIPDKLKNEKPEIYTIN